jgi:hypothetical protein
MAQNEYYLLMTNIDSLQPTNSLVFHHTDYIKTHSLLKQRSNVIETRRGPKIPSKCTYNYPLVDNRQGI